MGTISEEAEAYEPKQTKNISELEIVRTDAVITEESFGEGEDKFTAKIFEVEGEKYRMPVSVLKDLKTILKVKPTLKTFQVKKSGEGMKTNYTVIPIE